MAEPEPVGIAGIGVYAPPQIVTADDLAAETGVPADILRNKFGIRHVHRAGPDCHVSDMAVAAGEAALQDAGVDPADIDLVVYCGSEYKDHIVWSAATHIAHRLGCSRSEAFEVYALCAGTPITLRIVKDMMRAEGGEIGTALVVAASRESALVNRQNARTRFMFNFGDGASAAVLRRGSRRNELLGSASLVDGSLSKDAIMPAGGSSHPTSAETISALQHYLDVPDLDHMRDRLEEVSSENFMEVTRTALRRSGLDRMDNGGDRIDSGGDRIDSGGDRIDSGGDRIDSGGDRIDNGVDRIDFLAAVHMKRSMQTWLQEATGAERTFYLEEYGHMQAADQFTVLHEARARGLLRDGDIIGLLAAGVGYTWSASILRWGE